MNVLIYSACFLAAAFVSICFTWNVREIAKARGWTASPVSQRHVHKMPVPRLGGVAIYMTFLVCAVLLAITKAFWVPDLNFVPEDVMRVLLPGTLVFLVGLYDDMRGVSPRLKFATQIAAGLMLFAFGFKVIVPFTAANYHAPLSLGLTVFWIILISNSFNLIDGLDGLAAGTTLFSTVAIFGLSLWSGNHFVALMAAVLAGSVLGFLKFNFNPATIFLGDCGSLFLGFMLGSFALTGPQQAKTPTLFGVLIPVVSFGLPLTETALSVIRRWISGKPLFSADREHIHHKLLDRGLTHRQVVMVLYGVSALCAISSLALVYPGKGTVGAVVCFLGMLLLVGIRHLGYHEFFEIRRLAQRTTEQKRVVANNLSIRKTAEQLREVARLEDIRCILEDAFQHNDIDGFELVLRPPHRGGERTDTESSGYFITWSKEEKPRFGAGDNWNLSIELSTENSGHLGYFIIYRSYSNGSLLLDVNLLTNELRNELSIAAEMVLKNEEAARAATRAVDRNLDRAAKRAKQQARSKGASSSPAAFD
jgi:UDP-GlcNAc:undecaprenyl-phosphate/decaprenyl-phosphate GlcNAc-1-phosphate transferase